MQTSPQPSLSEPARSEFRTTVVCGSVVSRVNEPAYRRMVEAGVARAYRMTSAPFAGADREDAMTWGQERLAGLAADLYPWSDLNLISVWPLPPSSTETEVIGALSTILEQFEGLRTTFTRAADRARQRVIGSGRVPVVVVDAAEEHSDEAARRSAKALFEGILDPAIELPLRATIVVDGEVPRYLVTCVSHMVADQHSLLALKDYFGSLFRDRPDKPEPTISFHQPVEQAAFERSAAGLRANQRALRHFEGVLRSVPLTMFPRASAEFEPPRFKMLETESRALGMAVDLLAVRHQVSATAVLHAGLCAIMGFAADLDRAQLQIISSTRSDTRSRAAFGSYSSSVPTWIDLTDATMADLFQRSAAVALTGLFHARHREEDLNDLRRTIERERGGWIDLSCGINVRLAEGQPGTDAVDSLSGRTLDDALRQTRQRWLPFKDRSTSTYFMHVDSSKDAAIRLALIVDTSVLAPEEAAEWMRSLERVLCRAVVTDLAVADIGRFAGLTPFARPGRWSRIDASWIDLESVREWVAEASGTQDVRLETSPSPAGDRRLTAYVRPAGGMSEPARIRDRMLSTVTGRRTLMVPHAVEWDSGP